MISGTRRGQVESGPVSGGAGVVRFRERERVWKDFSCYGGGVQAEGWR
jgi:hypothetical protein